MMFNLLLIIFMTFHGAQSMINGLYANLGDFPFVVAIRNFNSYLCSGILINDFNVLTAAHVVNIVPVHLKLTVVTRTVVMSSTIDDGRDAYRVKAIYPHPHFAEYISEGTNETFFVNDIAVLQLFKKLHLSAAVGPASLANTEAPWGPEADCSIISWSRTSQGSMQLMWDKVSYVSDEESQRWGTYLMANQKGFNDLLEMNLISSDDIGSPIVCNNQIIGLVVKGGQRDQPKKPSTLLFTYSYIPFIWEIMSEGLFDIHPWKFPYAATIWSFEIPQCGGFIVDETHIVTTAYCTRVINSIDGKVTVGYTTVNVHHSNINWLSIKDIVKHPNYNVKNGIWPIHDSPNDIAVIILTVYLLWSPTISPLAIEHSENSDGAQVCQVLRWVPTPKRNRQLIRQLTLKRSVVVKWNEQQLECILEKQEETSFWGRTPYVMPIAERIDGGNPVICGNYPVGMVLQDGKPRSWNGPKSARFLKIQLFIEFINTVRRRTQFSS